MSTPLGNRGNRLTRGLRCRKPVDEPGEAGHVASEALRSAPLEFNSDWPVKPKSKRRMPNDPAVLSNPSVALALGKFGFDRDRADRFRNEPVEEPTLP